MKPLSESARKIKTMLSVLNDARFTHISPVENIKYAKCGYKRSNELPDPSTLEDYIPGSIWSSNMDEHAWFCFDINSPKDIGEGEFILKIRTDEDGWDAVNPQFMVYVDGKLTQGLDTNHMLVRLSGKKSYRLHIYAYGGMNHKLNVKLYADIFLIIFFIRAHIARKTSLSLFFRLCREVCTYLFSVKELVKDLWVGAVHYENGDVIIRDHSCGCQLSLHTARSAIGARAAGKIEYLVYVFDSVDKFSIGVLAGIAVVKSVNVGQIYKYVRANEIGNVGGENIVTAELRQLVRGYGVVLVYYRDTTHLEQGVECVFSRGATNGVIYYVARHEYLRYLVTPIREEAVVYLHKLALTDGCHRLLFFKRVGAVSESGFCDTRAYCSG